MALTFDTPGTMQYLWDHLEKTPDGKHIRYTPEDIDTLWWMGFVDVSKCPLGKWREVFEPYRQADGTFLLNQGAFFSLEKYRYTGEIMMPFDAMKINEGKYTDEGLQELFDLSIIPSCSKSPEEMNEFIGGLKKKYRQADGLIRVAREAKIEIKELLDNFPSPIRNLELIFDRMITDGLDQGMAEELETNETARATTEVARQVSKFSSAPTVAESQAKRLSGLEKLKPSRTTAAPKDVHEKPSTEIRKIKRSRKGMRG